MRNVVFELVSLALILFSINIPSTKLVVCDDQVPVPSNKAQVENWFKSNVKKLSERKGTLDPELEKAETAATPKIIHVKSDGSGDFKTINDAVKSIPDGNANRVVISIGPGIYNEKIKIERTKPFITFYAQPKNEHQLVFDGTSAQYGTAESATLIVESDYFNAYNIVFRNSAPRPASITTLAEVQDGSQTVSMRIGGDKASFYNCKFYGFQDTLCDDRGLHFFKDCFIEGTIDFIFGNGKSIYVNTMLNVVSGDDMAVVTAQARHAKNEDTGFSFLHCNIYGTGGIAYLGRSWMPYSLVIFSYTDMSDVVHQQGWYSNDKPETERTVYFGEFASSGPGSHQTTRAGFTKKLTDAEVKPYQSLSFIQASKWLLPPATF